MSSHPQQIDDGTVVPVAWLFKAFGFIMLSAGVIWWAATMTNDVQTIKKAVASVPQMQQDIAILKEREANRSVSPTSSAQGTPVMSDEQPSSGGTYQIAAARPSTTYAFQFDDCHGTPGQQIMKVGSRILLDNRDPETITIAFAGRSYRIGAYKSITVTALKVGTHQVTCDGGGAAIIIIEE